MVHSQAPFKRVFWCGSFIKAEVVRRYLTLEWRRRASNVGLMLGKVRERKDKMMGKGRFTFGKVRV